MPFVLVWKPVLRELRLADYHPDFGNETIAVCVNPSPETVKRRDDLIEQNAIRFTKTVEPATAKKKQARILEAKGKIDEYTRWMNDVYHVQMDQWFAELWSFGVEKYTIETIKEYRDVDPAFVNWLFVQSIEMIKEHNTGKKNS